MSCDYKDHVLHSFEDFVEELENRYGFKQLLTERDRNVIRQS